MASAQELLASAITFHEAPLRGELLPATFASSEESVARWTEVLLHEAREAMREPLKAPPESPYLHPVDVDTEEPESSAEETAVRYFDVRPPLHLECATGNERPHPQP